MKMSGALAFGLLLGCSSAVLWPAAVDTVDCDDVPVDAITGAVDEARDAWSDLGASGRSLVVSCFPRSDVGSMCPPGAESCALVRATDQTPAEIAVSIDEDLPAQVQHELEHLCGSAIGHFCADHAPACWRPLPCEAAGTCFTTTRSTAAPAP